MRNVVGEVQPYVAEVALTCALILIQRKPRGSSLSSCMLIISARPRVIRATTWGPWLGDRLYMQIDSSHDA